MLVTELLKSWLNEHAGVANEASDEECVEAATKAVMDDSLTPAKLAELTEEKAADDEEDELAKLIEDAVCKAVAPVAEQVGELGEQVAAKEAGSDAGELAGELASAMERNAQAKEDVMKAAADKIDATKIRNVEPIERYDATKTMAVYPRKHWRAGEPARMGDTPLYHPSQKDLAVAGAWYKKCVNETARRGEGIPAGLQMNDHDRELVKYTMLNEPFSGVVGAKGKDTGGVPVDGRKLSNMEVKALIDDATSGGQEAVPTVFDSAVVLTPVLHGELFPHVNLVPIPRGRLIEGFKMSNPTWTSGTAEGSAIPVFTTTAMVQAFDTTIFNVVGSIEIGRDFEEDSPVAMGSLIVQQYGEKLMEWLDNQIANGDGTTEPEGIFEAGLTDIGNPAGGAGAAAQVDDYESLMFGIDKQYRTPADKARTVFIANDTSYQRARAIAVGAADVRRVFGMDEESYNILGRDFKVQNDTANNLAAFVNLRYYRMYRRLGMTVRVEDGGKELARKNLTLIVVRARFGGQMELTTAGAFSNNWQA